MDFWIATLVGAFSQFVDGSIGMGFGMLSSTLLITLGASAALASASVHLSEIGTTLVSGLAHWKRGNVDLALLSRIALPGALGAFIGANFLSSLDLTSAKDFVSTVLLILGFFVIYKTIRGRKRAFRGSRGAMTGIGLVAGFVDAAGGGGWGPMATPLLLTATEVEPRKIVGTVNAAEFIVALSASAGFLLNIEKIGFDWRVVAGLAIGGMVVAPLAARIVSILPRIWLGIAVGVGIILLNGLRLLA